MTTDYSPWTDLPGLASSVDHARADGHPLHPVEAALPFKTGDVVRLKSGGPKMTVILCSDIEGVLGADALWFVEGKTEAARFPAEALVAVVATPPTPRPAWWRRILLRLRRGGQGG